MASGRQSKGVTAASNRVLEALRHAIEDPGTEANRAAADAIVALRRLFTHEGVIDWAGRSAGYRDLIERLYRQAGVPSDSESNMQANIRYHLGNVLRKVAPPEDLSALGMSVEGPLSRVRSSRAAQPKKPRVRASKVSVGDPEILAALALDAVRAIRSTGAGAAGVGAVGETMRQIIDESVAVLSEQH